MKFEWDKKKEEINIKKHGFDFSTAALVFNDNERIEMYDQAHSIDEDRFVTIGEIKNVLIVVMVVYTEKEPDIIRIISARKATSLESEAYYDSKGN